VTFFQPGQDDASEFVFGGIRKTLPQACQEEGFAESGQLKCFQKSLFRRQTLEHLEIGQVVRPFFGFMRSLSPSTILARQG
jgi:hypothetical protein